MVGERGSALTSVDPHIVTTELEERRHVLEDELERVRLPVRGVCCE